MSCSCCSSLKIIQVPPSGGGPGVNIYNSDGSWAGPRAVTLETGATLSFVGDFGPIISLDGDTGKVTIPGVTDPVHLVGSPYNCATAVGDVAAGQAGLYVSDGTDGFLAESWVHVDSAGNCNLVSEPGVAGGPPAGGIDCADLANCFATPDPALITNVTTTINFQELTPAQLTDFEALVCADLIDCLDPAGPPDATLITNVTQAIDYTQVVGQQLLDFQALVDSVTVIDCTGLATCFDPAGPSPPSVALIQNVTQAIDYTDLSATQLTDFQTLLDSLNGDDWGAQVVASDATLSGTGILGDLLSVDFTGVTDPTQITAFNQLIDFTQLPPAQTTILENLVDANETVTSWILASAGADPFVRYTDEDGVTNDIQFVAGPAMDIAGAIGAGAAPDTITFTSTNTVDLSTDIGAAQGANYVPGASPIGAPAAPDPGDVFIQGYGDVIAYWVAQPGPTFYQHAADATFPISAATDNWGSQVAETENSITGDGLAGTKLKLIGDIQTLAEGGAGVLPNHYYGTDGANDNRGYFPLPNATRFVKAFVDTDWLAGGGEWTYTVPAAEHGLGVDPIVQVVDANNEVIATCIEINPSGDVKLTVPGTPSGLQFAGKIRII